MSDSNLASLAFVKETTFGTSPVAGYRLVRITGESLITEKESLTSEEIRSDRQVPDLAKVHNQPSGSFEFEMSVLQLQAMVELALQNDFVVFALNANFGFDSTAQTISAAAGDFDALPIGSMIKVSGADAGNNGFHRVVNRAVDGSTITLVAGSLGTDESVVCDVAANSISNGIIRKSSSFEKRIVNSQGQDFFQLFKGLVADTLSLNIESRAISTGSLSFIGTSGTKSDDSIDPDGYEDQFAGDILNGTSNVGTIRTDGQAATEKFKTLTLELANNLRGKDAIGEEGNFDIGMGRCLVTGTLNAYFRNNDFLTAVDDHSDLSIDISLTDSAGRLVAIYLPRVKFQNGSNGIEAIDTDVMVDTEWQSLIDPITGKQIFIDIFDV